ncbi:hypothetical protein [Mycolicibacterium baixiangningiae]|uniref:hypothetical protein n=1 Tax=Mycolicibacterium baixiangningiae TaxID=2761578 RepID=UPI00384DA814
MLTFRELRRFHRADFPGVWTVRGSDPPTDQRAGAAWLWSGRRAVVAGLSASALHGAKWIGSDIPIELIHTNRRPPAGVIVRTERLAAEEVQTIGQLPVTSAARTVFDLGRRMSLRDGVQRIDALLNATDVKIPEVETVIARHPGVRGLRQLRATLGLVDGGAESPYESLTRLVLVQAGFPPPQTQIEVFDDYGWAFARIDMGWPEYLVGVDFEGAHHWTDPGQRSGDVVRYARLSELGWIDVRLTSGILHTRTQWFLDRVGAALESRGCPKTW